MGPTLGVATLNESEGETTDPSGNNEDESEPECSGWTSVVSEEGDRETVGKRDVMEGDGHRQK